MSAKEKFDSLVQQAKIQRETEAEARQSQEHLETAQRMEVFRDQQVERERIRNLYEEGLPAAEQDQIRLFNRLKKIGVVGGLTEITDRKYFAPRKSIRNITGYLVKPSLGFAREVLDENGWHVSIGDPVMDPSGMWEKGVMRIRADYKYRAWEHGGMKMRRRDFVTINYSNSGLLVIAGAEENFNNFVDHKNPTPEQTEQVEWALATAFHQPKVEDLSDFGKEQAAQQQFRAELMDHYGSAFGAAMGAFIFDYFQPEMQPEINDDMARAFVEKHHGSDADQILAVAGLLEAIRSGMRNELGRVEHKTEWARRHSRIILATSA